ncbi:phosphatases ii [Phaffia rhodozyma]|uniref:Phosphatases ii n=1 Tax=Phaffia rhodozyma TaxID=264483 RepID=A0A0F7SPV4_PHARH|nr:phosphatases ii [Phaffia rhodozyma]
MDVIRISKVEEVQLENKGLRSTGTLHLTLHHLIFECPSSPELWISYPLINQVNKLPQSFNGRAPILIRTRLFQTYVLFFEDESTCLDVFETIKDLTVSNSIEKVYAFTYSPSPPLEKCDGWNVFTPREEFTRMGVGSRTKAWRFTDINKDYSFSSTYPAKLAVPARISDSALTHASKYRSKERIPALTYLHWANYATITRSSQPLVGLKQARSIQDEKLIEAIFQTHLFNDSAYTPSPQGQTAGTQQIYGATATNLIVDARPTTNAMANVAKGAGTENMDNYRLARKVYLNIENIHVMRDSLNKVIDALRESEPIPGSSAGHYSATDFVQPPPLDRQALRRSNWLKHTTSILEGSTIIVRNIHINSSHVLIHCSDGWDRTAQLSAVAQLCLDPFYRTIKGFMVLVEKDWLSFGHKFLDRCGHLSSDKYFHYSNQTSGGGIDPSSLTTNGQEESTSLSSSSSGGGGSGGSSSAQAWFASVQKQFSSNSHLKETSPVFHQFLDTVWQIQRQFPTRFEFDDTFLRMLLEQLYTCQFGTFLFNSERERRMPPEFGPKGSKPPQDRTVSVWDWVSSEHAKERFLNARYDKSEDLAQQGNAGILFPNPKDVRFWADVFGRGDEEMNGRPVIVSEEPPLPTAGSPAVYEKKEDPVVKKVVEDSQSIQDGKLSILDGITGASFPYRPRSNKKPVMSLSSPTASPGSPPVDLQTEEGNTGHQSSSSSRTISSYPHSSASSTRELNNSTSSWGGTWAQFSSGARSALSGAAKEIGRVANQAASVGGGAGNSTGSGASGGGSTGPLGRESSRGSSRSAWQEERPFSVIPRKMNSLTNNGHLGQSTVEENPWSEEDQTPSVLRAGGDTCWILAPAAASSSSPLSPSSPSVSSSSAPGFVPSASFASSSSNPSLSNAGLSHSNSFSTLPPSTSAWSSTSSSAPIPTLSSANPSSSVVGTTSPTSVPYRSLDKLTIQDVASDGRQGSFDRELISTRDPLSPISSYDTSSTIIKNGVREDQGKEGRIVKEQEGERPRLEREPSLDPLGVGF